MHTSGPWYYEQTIHADLITTKKGVIAEIRDTYDGLDVEEYTGNGFLIAAAPELLAVCELALQTIARLTPFPTGQGGPLNAAINQTADEADTVRAQLTAAIAKAKGDTR